MPYQFKIKPVTEMMEFLLERGYQVQTTKDVLITITNSCRKGNDRSVVSGQCLAVDGAYSIVSSTMISRNIYCNFTSVDFC